MIEIENAVIGAGGFELRAELRAPGGEVCAVIGPSGGGKSTLLAGIAGFAPLLSGRIAVGGQDLAGLAPADRPVTLLFQEHNLFPALTAAQNVGLGLKPSLSLDAAERARVAQALADVGLDGLGDRRPGALSGGQRQRAALARALLRDRPALLLDEPFAALGPAQRREMMALVERLTRPRGVAVIMVTHDPGEARRADRIAFCDADRDTGRIEGARPAADAFADPSPALAAYLGEGQ